LGLPVSWSGPSASANPTGNPNFNLKNRPEVSWDQFKFLFNSNFSSILIFVKNIFGVGVRFGVGVAWRWRGVGVALAWRWRGVGVGVGSFDLLVILIYQRVNLSSVDISGVDISSIYGSRYIVGRYIGGQYIVGRYIAVDRFS
jgi:hypothetical protein